MKNHFASLLDLPSAVKVLATISFLGTCGVNLFSADSTTNQNVPKLDSRHSELGSLAERNPSDLRFQPDPALPNVLLLGDSISLGYTLPVRHLLQGKANVFRPLNADGTAVNCADTGNGLAELDRWLAIQPKWDVIYFNFGPHDLKHMKRNAAKRTASNDPNDPPLRTVEEYRANLEKLAIRLQPTGGTADFRHHHAGAGGLQKPFSQSGRSAALQRRRRRSYAVARHPRGRSLRTGPAAGGRMAGTPECAFYGGWFGGDGFTGCTTD